MLEDLESFFANFDGAKNACRTVALWVTIALVIAFVVTKLYVYVQGKRSDKHAEADFAAVNRLINGAWIIIALSVAALFIITFTACYFVDVANGDEYLVPLLFYPLLVLAVVIVASAAVIFVKPIKTVKIVCASVFCGALIAVIVCMAVFYACGDPEFGMPVPALSDVGLYLSAAIITAAVIAFALISDREKRPFDTKMITFAAICVALSFALSYVRLFKMPMGGSITFASMLPLMLFAFMFGCRKGLLVGLVYGVLQAIQDAWIINPAQFILDYGVAFAAIGLTGCMRDLKLFKNNMRAQFALGALIACAFRFASHYFAGVFAFGTYGSVFASDYGMPALANEYFYSFVYQCMYLLPELAIVLAVSMIVFASGNFRKQIEKYSPVKRRPIVSVEETSSAANEPAAECNAADFEKAADEPVEVPNDNAESDVE